MIRVRKSQNVPAILSQQGKKAAEECCRRYDLDAADFDSGLKKFRAQSSIYGHSSVKTKLQEEHHYKCCFCEADFTANGYGDVEHFRPKGGYQTTLKGQLNRPGYYWLAYEWKNLFFSCQIRNQRYKKNFFPIENEALRAKNHAFDVVLEVPDIIHPALDDPAKHLKFNKHVLTHKTLKGYNSIRGYGLKRQKLNDARKQHLDGDCFLNCVKFGFE